MQAFEIISRSYENFLEPSDDVEAYFEDSMKTLQYQRSSQLKLTCDSILKKKRKTPNLDSLYNNKYKVN